MEQSYKEKYEQAIERLKQWDREHPCAGYVLSDRDKFIFPELKESWDEKMRKAIKEALSSKQAEDIIESKYKIKMVDVSDWLEKQGQVKESTISQHENRTCEENDDSLTSEDERIREALVEMVHDTTDDGLWVCYNVHKEEALAWLERQGEQKTEKNKGNIVGISSNWSEEDERLCQCLIEDQEEFLDRVSNDKYGHSEIISDLKEMYHERIDWLKSLKGRVGCEANCTTTKEWSEEDKKIINGLIDSLTRISLNTRTDSTSPNFSFYKEIDWLKSLRPQNRWKPSDEQMWCLSDAIEHYNSLGYPAPKLKELLDDLKKLKEGKV